MRVAFFIDGKNFYIACVEKAPGLEIDYNKLVRWGVGQIDPNGGKFVGAYYYTGYKASTGDPQVLGGAQGPAFNSFLNNLAANTGFFVSREPRVLRKTICPRCEQRIIYETEKRVDVRLATDLIHYAAVDNYDAAILFSGDQDFVPAVEEVRRYGKQVFIGSWEGRGVSKELRERCYGEINFLKGRDEFSTGRIRQSRPVRNSMPALNEALTLARHTDTNPSDREGLTLPEPAPSPPDPKVLAEQDEAVFIEAKLAQDMFDRTGKPLTIAYFTSIWSGWQRRNLSPSQVMDSLQRLKAEGKVIEYSSQDGNSAVRAIKCTENS